VGVASEPLEEGVQRLRELAARAGREPGDIQITARHSMKIVERAPGPAPGGSPNAWPLFGAVEQVKEAVQRFQEAGVNHLVMDTFYSIPELHGETVDSVLHSMECFARGVLPLYADT